MKVDWEAGFLTFCAKELDPLSVESQGLLMINVVDVDAHLDLSISE